MANSKPKIQKKWWDDIEDKYWKGEIQACLEAMYPKSDKVKVNENNVIDAILNDDQVWEVIDSALAEYIDQNLIKSKSKTR